MKNESRHMTVIKKPERGSSLRWNGRSGSPNGRTIWLVMPLPTAQTPPAMPSMDATEERRKHELIKRRWFHFKSGTNKIYSSRSRTDKEISARGSIITLLPYKHLCLFLLKNNVFLIFIIQFINELLILNLPYRYVKNAARPSHELRSRSGA